MNMHPVGSSISMRARALEASKIRAVAETAMGRRDVIPLWFGEGAWETDPLIVEAAVASLRSGNHMYQPNNGA
jgi:aspartate/methionine/tyrosine aminotransferase